MSDIALPKASAALAARRHALAPEIDEAFAALSKSVFAEGALEKRTKQLIALAVARVIQCPWCIEVIPRAPGARMPPMSRSWRRSGSQPRCGPEPPMLMLALLQTFAAAWWDGD